MGCCLPQGMISTNCVYADLRETPKQWASCDMPTQSAGGISSTCNHGNTHTALGMILEMHICGDKQCCGRVWHSPCSLCVFLYSIHVPWWLQKWLNLITAPGSVSNEPGSVTWLATNYLNTVSWKNHTEKLTTWWPQNILFWPKINIPSSYFTILMLNCLENTLKLCDSYVTAVKFWT